MRKRRMRSVLALSLMLGLSGCGEKASEEVMTTAEAITSAEEITTAEAIMTAEATTEETTAEVISKIRIDLWEKMGNPGAGDAGVRNESGIKELFWSTASGWGFSESYSFAFSDSTEVKVHIYRNPKFSDINVVDVTDTFTLDKETAAKIEALYDKYQIWRWKGYDMRAPVTDGAGMTVEIVFQDGERLKAHGYVASPDGYGEFREELEEIMAPKIEEANLHRDDAYISEIRNECLALLREEKYYNAAGGFVTVTVTKSGEVRVSNVGKRTSDLTDELMYKVFGEKEIKKFFQSYAYREGGDTILEFMKDETFGSWTCEIYNQIRGSAYYRV